jgi:protoporphyrinogen oxidase
MIRKVWGTQDLHRDFARIRFELPTVGTMLKRAVRGRSLPGVRMFYYPRRGFGAIPEAISGLVQRRGHRIELSSRLRAIEAGSLKGPFRIVYAKGGAEQVIEADQVVSTISNQSLIRCLDPACAAPLLPLAHAFPSRTMRLGIVVVKGYRLPARVIIFPEEHLLFNRLSSFDRFSPELCPGGHAVLMCDVICDQGGSYDSMDERSFNAALADALLGLGWFRREHIVHAFNVRIPGAYPVLNQERYDAQERIESYFDGSGIFLCGREASSDYNNAHNAIGKGLLVADHISGKIDARTMRESTRTVGRLPIQD